MSTKIVLEQARTLSAHGKLADADDLLERACASAPDDVEMLIARAEIASRRRDWERAERLWLLVLETLPDHSSAVAQAANAMRHQRKFDPAESLLKAALASKPNDQVALELLAQVAAGRGDWREAERRWGDVVRAFPSSVAAWSGQAHARSKLGDLAGADVIATQAAGLFPNDQSLLSLHARLANHAQNWPAAERRWDRLRQLARDNPDYWHEQARALRQQNRPADAHALLVEAAALFPNHRDIAWLRAHTASDLSLWPEASMLLSQLAAANPEDQRIQERAVEANWRAARTATAASDPLLAGRPALNSSIDDYRRLMLRFEALGTDEEFGRIQRFFHAEPLDLLRWAEIGTADLARALDDDLTGVGNPENTVLDADNRAVDRRYGLSLRLLAGAQSDEPAKTLTEQCRQMCALREKLLADLAAGDKIFVHTTAAPPRADDLNVLHRAMQRHGKATLLNVRPATPDLSNGTIQEIAPGLLAGYVGRCGVGEAKWDADQQSWLDLCLNADNAVRTALSHAGGNSERAAPGSNPASVEFTLDKAEIVAHFDEAFAKAQRFEDPYLLYYFKPFPDHVFAQILACLPESRHYANGKHPDGIRLDGTSARLAMVLRDEHFRGMPEHQRKFWSDLNTILRSDELREVIKKWHAPALMKRFKTPLSEIAAVPLPLLIRDLHFYRIGIHPDTPMKTITVQFYLPRDESLRHLGTEIYGRDGAGKFHLARKLEYLPNSGYSFAVTENSWHGVRVLTEEAAVRDSMMLVYYLEPQDDYRA
jgi:tetratricopeptide (TPR) repeat protein